MWGLLPQWKLFVRCCSSAPLRSRFSQISSNGKSEKWTNESIALGYRNLCRRSSPKPPTLLNFFSNNDGVKTDKLVIILSWFQARPKVLKKYTNYYLIQQSDAIVVHVKAQHALWAERGVKLIAKELLQFLAENEKYERVVVHGFSGGSIVWGQVLELMTQDSLKFEAMGKRIAGQVWDSIMVLDIETGVKNLPVAIFPSSQLLQLVFHHYLKFHARTFYNTSTRYYLQSLKSLRESTMIKSPILIFGSRDDHISWLDNVQDIADCWREKGIQVETKLWDSSPHVGHLIANPDEYEETLKMFLEKLDFVPFPSKFSRRANDDKK